METGILQEEFTRRTRMVLGEAGSARLRDACVTVFGLGGVGSYVVEALARSGVGRFRLVDADTVAPTNLNRQLIATVYTIGEAKTEAEKNRILSINPNAMVETYPLFYGADTARVIPWTDTQYAVDAIDTVTAKLLVIEQARRHHVPVISSMGTGNKLDPSRLVVTDIYATKMDPLARVMRRELRKRGVPELKVVYSEEVPLEPQIAPEELSGPKIPPGSTAFVPGAAGLLIASVVVAELAAAE